jgi:probable HAF family extracellular repeat protein
MQDLGTLGGSGSVAYGINNNGQVVGQSDMSIGSPHAFLYSGGQMMDLNTLLPANSGWVLLDARAINDAGQIVGGGSFQDGRPRAFLLTPTPEPATFVLCGGALVGLVLLRHRATGGSHPPHDNGAARRGPFRVPDSGYR